MNLAAGMLMLFAAGVACGSVDGSESQAEAGKHGGAQPPSKHMKAWYSVVDQAVEANKHRQEQARQGPNPERRGIRGLFCCCKGRPDDEVDPAAPHCAVVKAEQVLVPGADDQGHEIPAPPVAVDGLQMAVGDENYILVQPPNPPGCVNLSVVDAATFNSGLDGTRRTSTPIEERTSSWSTIVQEAGVCLLRIRRMQTGGFAGWLGFGTLCRRCREEDGRSLRGRCSSEISHGLRGSVPPC